MTSTQGSGIQPLRGLRSKPRSSRTYTEEGRISKPLHGTPQAYLPFVAGVGFATSPIVSSWLMGRP
jgi:hypothetical protein